MKLLLILASTATLHFVSAEHNVIEAGQRNTPLCGIHGDRYLRPYFVTQEPSFSKAAKCGSLCKSQRLCQSFAVEKGFCGLYSLPSRVPFLTGNKLGTIIFYDKACNPEEEPSNPEVKPSNPEVLPSVCTPEQGIQNGDFKNGYYGWKAEAYPGCKINYWAVSGYYKDQAWIMQVERQSTTTPCQFKLIAEGAKMCPETSYSLKFDMAYELGGALGCTVKWFTGTPATAGGSNNLQSSQEYSINSMNPSMRNYGPWRFSVKEGDPGVMKRNADLLINATAVFTCNAQEEYHRLIVANVALTPDTIKPKCPGGDTTCLNGQYICYNYVVTGLGPSKAHTTMLECSLLCANNPECNYWAWEQARTNSCYLAIAPYNPDRQILFSSDWHSGVKSGCTA